MVDEATLQVVRSSLPGIKVASPQDRVLKNECCFSFDTAESPGGLYINLRTFQAFGQDYLALDQQRTKNTLYLHETAHRVPLEEENNADKEAVKIRPEGGMQVSLGGGPKYRIEKQKELVVIDPSAGSTLRVPLPCPELPELLLQAIASLEAHEDSSLKDHVTEWAEELKPSRYAQNLPQLEPQRKISPNPKDWRCDETGVTENLWLNLSTGFIGSGRQNFDGSGGNGAALRHYEATGRKYPLVVKLGTLSPHGGDVFSYADDENDMVLDPHLSKHLAHWGINMMQMEKTEKTTAELQLELNLNYEYSRITEEGSKMKPLSGPGLTGLINLGNTCYMNSVLQLMSAVPGFRAKYAGKANELFKSAPSDPTTDLGSQLSKVAVALTTGRTGHVMPQEALPTDNTVEEQGAHPPKPTASEDLKVLAHAVRPAYFKSVIGRGHPEFSTFHQQDAVEFFQHLLNQVARFERTGMQRMGTVEGHPMASLPTPSYFNFKVQERDECSESHMLRYKFQETNTLALDIPEEAATNKDEVAAYKERAQQHQASGEKGEKPELVIPNVPFAACIERLASPESVADVFSPALGRKTTATRTTRLASFPPYLMVSFKRYYVGENWVPKKLEVAVDVPMRINLEHLRGKGPQQGEALQPEVPEAPPESAPRPTADPALVAQLSSMGFSEHACARAALAVGNSGPEAAMEWLLGHMEDPDINTPLESAPSAAGSVSEESVSTLAAMGFSTKQAQAALKACGGNMERAVDWLFSHADEPLPEDTPAAPQAAAAPEVMDGPGEYELVGFVSHMGSNTACGHYVAHIRVGDRWVIYNDEKVAESERPPLDLGYMYMFKRIDV